jgi:DNA-directed RNA polymerase subunit M/transcription elongation factor TFIIS
MLVADRGRLRAVEPAITGPLRARLRACLEQALQGVGDSLQPPRPDLYAAQLEMAALALCRGRVEAYTATLSRVVYNLQTNGVVIVGRYPVSRIPCLSHVRMEAETSHALRDAAIEAQVKSLLADAEATAVRAVNRAANVTAAAAIRCPKCKTQDRIVRVLQQSRCADEGMTTQCLCMACNQSWRLA